MNLQEAQRIANEVVSTLNPLCLKIAVAGSVRRGKMQMIKDVELCLIPNNKMLFDFARVLNTQWGEPQLGKFPSKYCRIRGRYNLDVFICSPASFGLNFFIRTGPDTFCRRALSDWKRITAGGYSKDAALHLANGTVVPTPTEADVFKALRWNFVKPENRT